MEKTLRMVCAALDANLRQGGRLGIGRGVTFGVGGYGQRSDIVHSGDSIRDCRGQGPTR